MWLNTLTLAITSLNTSLHMTKVRAVWLLLAARPSAGLKLKGVCWGVHVVTTRTDALDRFKGQLGEATGSRWSLYSLVAAAPLSIMGFIGLGAEFVLRPAGGGVDRSQRRSRRDGRIIKPRRSEGECVVTVVVVDEFSLHVGRLGGMVRVRGA